MKVPFLFFRPLLANQLWNSRGDSLCGEFLIANARGKKRETIFLCTCVAISTASLSTWSPASLPGKWATPQASRFSMLALSPTAPAMASWKFWKGSATLTRPPPNSPGPNLDGICVGIEGAEETKCIVCFPPVSLCLIVPVILVGGIVEEHVDSHGLHNVFYYNLLVASAVVL